MKATTLLETSPQLEVYTISYWPPKLRESQFREFQDSQFGSRKAKSHLGAGPVARHKKYYKGEIGGFPQVRFVVSLMNSCLPVVCLCTKCVPTMH